jgi:hypothetical protein
MENDLTNDTRVIHRFNTKAIESIEMNSDGAWEVYDKHTDNYYVLRGTMVITFKADQVIFS